MTDEQKAEFSYMEDPILISIVGEEGVASYTLTYSDEGFAAPIGAGALVPLECTDVTEAPLPNADGYISCTKTYVEPSEEPSEEPSTPSEEAPAPEVKPSEETKAAPAAKKAQPKALAKTGAGLGIAVLASGLVGSGAVLVRRRNA
ncbi:hypothetical protein [Actinomyces urogenitalis]|uniref:hypothetical protein n=1 Tax=Actinomyces urogenitalis TaxID=103621 RepID=UPI00242D55FA|nr:hypothetical protein [Actinomyces urogenitalis]MCI7456758.1 hypothetical protein [Actinomyces urogenitalis]